MNPHKPTVEAGCGQCGQKFYLPVDLETGEPIWTHSCPETTEQKLARMEKMLGKIMEKIDGQN